jgi:general secretion pathway protein A
VSAQLPKVRFPGASPSLTYEPYYGLKEKPFSLSADPRFLYRSPAHEPAFEELLNGIRRREGLIVLTGEIGTGKTTLIRSVLEHLDRRTFTAFVPDPFVSREDLLKMLLVDFGVVSLADLKRGSLSGASRPDLSYPLYEFLDSLVPLQAFAVLIIDEAQNLPLSLLEEIRILSDLEQREKLLQVVLVGQPELRVHLKLPEMRQVNQRVSIRCELTPLTLTDVGRYIRHRLSVASEGESRVQFSDDAIGAIFDASGGTPRVINLVCDRALQRGHRVRAEVIDRALVAEAVASLGIETPAPVVVETPAPAVIETPKASSAEAPQAVTAAPEHVLGAFSHSPAAPATASAEFRIEPIASPAPEATNATPVRVTRFAESPQFWSEFAAEAESSGPLGGDRFRRVVAWLLGCALITGGLTGAIYAANGAVGVETMTLPAPPSWTRPVQAPEPPGIEIAEIETPAP